jgi:acetylornithine deacetylase
MERLDGFQTKVVAFTTDLPNLTHWGKPLLLGPGSINDAHTDHERVSKAELSHAVDLYFSLVQQLLASA